MMEIKEIYDKMTVVRWIDNSDSDHVDDHIRNWMNNKLYCVQFINNKMPIGFILWHFTGRKNGEAFIDYITVKNHVKEIFDLLVAEYCVDSIKMMTTRPDAWGRLMGFDEVGTIMTKEIKHEDIHKGGDVNKNWTGTGRRFH